MDNHKKKTYKSVLCYIMTRFILFMFSYIFYL